MIETIDDGFSHDAIKRPKIGHPTDLWFNGASDAHVDLIIVAVSVWVVAFAENLRILLSGQAFGVKTVRRRELVGGVLTYYDSRPCLNTRREFARKRAAANLTTR